MQKYFSIAFVSTTLFVSGCASQTGWKPTVDPYNPAYDSTYGDSGYNQPYYPPQGNPNYKQPSQGYQQAPRNQQPRQSYQPTNNQNYQRPNYNSPEALRHRYQRDLAECEQLALRSSGGTPTETAKGAIVGGLIGAAGGAAIGAVVGDPGAGAAIGAAAGGIGGAAKQGIGAEDQYKRAYRNCLRNRGHRVID